MTNQPTVPTFADKVIDYNTALQYTGSLPAGFSVINPFASNAHTMAAMKSFYRKYYHDHRPRFLLAGINPGRHGAGVTGIPFTDTKRLQEYCGISMNGVHTHEPSSVFIYEMIEAFGGPEKFYSSFYINSPFPLAITRQSGKGMVNANYYDDKLLTEMLTPFMSESLQKHCMLGLHKNVVFVLGRKNALFFEKLNQKIKLFENIVVLDHPRYIQQYKSKQKQEYITQYLDAFNQFLR